MPSQLVPAQQPDPSALSTLTGGTALAGGGGDQSHADPLKALGRIVASLRRFRLLILTLALVGLGGGILATRFIEPVYEVQASVWIENAPGRNQGPGPIQGAELLTARAWMELLRQYTVLDPVVRERRLYLPAATGKDSSVFQGFDLVEEGFFAGKYELKVGDDGRSLELFYTQRGLMQVGQAGDSLGRDLGLLWVPRPGPEYAGKTIAFEVLTPREASRSLSSRVSTTLREDRFLVMQFADANPDHAAATLNALVARFVDEAGKQKKQRLTLFKDELTNQVEQARLRMQAAESALENFKVNTVTMPREDIPVAPGLQMTSSTVYGSYFQQRQTLETLRRDRQSMEDVLTRVDSGAAVDAFYTIPSVKNAPELQGVLSELTRLESQLRDSLSRYTEEYRGVRQVRDRIAHVRTVTIPLYARALIGQMKIQEQELERLIASQGAEMRSIPTRVSTENQLTRERVQAEQMFTQLDNALLQARLAEASAIPEVTALDPAIAPTRPSKNTAPTLIFFGLVVGLGLGVGIALLADRLDPRFRYPEQVSRGLGLPILGTIPEIRRAKGLRSTTEEAAQVIEAFRSVRLNLAHSFESQGPIILTISSPSPGDGKSLISSNLALSFAEAGYRTVLVDGDTRRGELHRTFGAERRPGLVDCVLGHAELSGILRPTTHPNLMLIPCGTRRSQSPELLGSARMQELVAKLKGAYDVILMDSPPLGAGIDPFVLATACGSLVLVLRAGETDRQLAEAKLQVLDRLPVRLLGAILNDVRVGQGAYKYDSYSYGYLAEDEAQQLPANSTAGAE